MMHSNRFSKILELKQLKEDEIKKSLQEKEKQCQDIKNFIEQLKGFALSYQEEALEMAKRGASLIELQPYYAFIQNIRTSLPKQEKKLLALESEKEGIQAACIKAYGERKAMAILSEKEEKTKQYSDAKKEQRTQDDFSAANLVSILLKGPC